jgi:hypothetical protein
VERWIKAGDLQAATPDLLIIDVIYRSYNAWKMMTGAQGLALR